MRKRIPWSVLLIFLCSLPLAADSPGIFALTGGTVHTVTGSDIENGVVLIRDGLIERVGANLAVPADATVIDVKGMHVYPGLIDAQTSIGLPPPPKPASGPWWLRANEPADPNRPEPTPSLIAARLFRPTDDTLETKRSTGVTTVLIAPAAGIFNGQTAVVNLSGDTPQAMLLKTPATLQISFNPRNDGKFPDSLMGVITHIRQTFLDARHYSEASAVYGRSPAGKQRPAPDPNLDGVGPWMRRELPVVMMVDSELDMRRAVEIGKEFNLRLILSGARQSYRAADFLKSAGVPVFVSVNYPKPPPETEDRELQPLRFVRDRVLSPTGPAELARRNVPFALVSGTASAGDYIKGIRKTVDHGLSEKDALRAVTLSPAMILGIERQVGSLDAGKIANIFVTDKKFHERESKVKHLFIDGRIVRLPREDEKKKEGDGASASPFDGTWNLTIRGSEGEFSMQVTLRAEGENLTGSYSGDRGSGEVRSGSVSGNDVRFIITASVPSGETSDWSFSGTLSGDTIQGTVTTTSGSFQFTGSKPK